VVEEICNTPSGMDTATPCECPSSTPFRANGECLEACAEALPFHVAAGQEKQCVSECPSGTEPDSETNACQKPPSVPK
jgi:hypothetical protein